MRVQVEMALRGIELRLVIDVYEAFPTGVLTGDWNLTQNHRRYLFLVRLENGRYRVVRDFWRSSYPVYSGRHNRLPLGDAMPVWERFALLQWWVQPDRSDAFGKTMYADTGWALGGGEWLKSCVVFFVTQTAMCARRRVRLCCIWEWRRMSAGIHGNRKISRA